MVGLTNNRSIQDEKLIEAIFQSHWAADSAFAPVVDSPSSSSRSRGPGVYGATATNLIIDARPTTNAMVMSVKGAGTENMEYYKDGKKAYLGVDNIHVMRESLSKVADALRDADQLASLHGKEAAVEGTSFLDRQALRKSGWLKHISAILDGTLIIIKNIHINSSHVLIHCSDGWDRTAQLSSLSQICLDPFYRTLRGFQILVEKDWLSFGHRFADRCGHLSSEKFFTTATGDGQAGSGNTDAAAAFLASMQNKFTPQSHLKETSPVFHQFLECVRQIQRQFPARFEYNEEFLRRLHYHLYSCQFGTFLWNNERERRTAEPGVGMPMERTRSVWDFLSSSHERPKFINPEYDPALDDRESRSPGADMGVLLFDPKDVRFWHELYGRTDEDMNGRLVTSQAVGVDVIGPVDTAEGDPIMQEGEASVANIPLPPSPAPSPVPGDATKQTSLPYQPRSMSSLRAPSLTVPPSTGGSTSASPLSAAAEVPGQPPLSRSDSFRPMEASGSAFSLKAASVGQAPFSGSTAAPQPRSPTPKRTVAEGPSVASMGVAGFRSLWGQVSSNASAALTVVQGAYEGARKDIRVPAFQLPGGFSGPPSAAGGGEMQEKLGSSSADRKWSGFEDEPSPWASSTRSVPSPLSENPWATSSAPLPSTAFSQRPLESSSSYIRQSTSENSKPLGSGSVTQSRVSDFPGLEDPLFARRPVSSSPATDNNKRSVGPLTNDLESLTLSHSSSTITSSRISSATGPSNVAVPATPSRQSLPQNPPSEPDSGQASDPLGVGFL
ncbi:hypothetical protein FRC00_002510 [Tulasnella sp. 408]|nr:hypothetical protein FRC00_002510 [Tulasnella sp. 408]